MAMLDMDYASKRCTCKSDNVGLGETVKMVIALVWRNPDMSTG